MRLFKTITLSLAILTVASIALQAAPTTLFEDKFDRGGQTQTAAKNGWVHDAGTADDYGVLAIGRNGRSIFGIMGRWSHPLNGKPVADGKVTVSAYLDPAPYDFSTPCYGEVRLSLTNAPATSWEDKETWSGYGPTLFFSSETKKVWLRQPAGAGNAESKRVEVPGKPNFGTFIMVIDTSTGLADAYYKSIEPANKLISGFDMKGKQTLAEFKTNIQKCANIFWWDQLKIGPATNGQMNNLSITTEAKEAK